MNQKSVLVVGGYRLAQLLPCPPGGGVSRCVAMQNSPGAMLQNDENVQDLKCYCDSNKEITRQNRFSVVTQEGGPALIATWPA